MISPAEVMNLLSKELSQRVQDYFLLAGGDELNWSNFLPTNALGIETADIEIIPASSSQEKSLAVYNSFSEFKFGRALIAAVIKSLQPSKDNTLGYDEDFILTFMRATIAMTLLDSDIEVEAAVTAEAIAWISKQLSRRYETVSGVEYPLLSEVQTKNKLVVNELINSLKSR
jgi:hypothetical protein